MKRRSRFCEIREFILDSPSTIHCDSNPYQWSSNAAYVQLAARRRATCSASAARVRCVPTPCYEVHAGFETNIPHTVALVKLEEGFMITSLLTDVDNDAVEIGMPVEMVTRRMRNDGDERGLIVYGYKFRPTLNHI